MIKDSIYVSEEEFCNAQVLCDFLNYKESIQKSDLIFVLCSHYPRVADYAADLMIKGIASKILFSGGLNFFTRKIFEKSEAEDFKRVALLKGIPETKILIETKSTNT